MPAGTALDGPVRVHRGGQVGALAGALDARAFTHQGEVFLPASAGPLGLPAARSLLAHELTHVAQQRALGSNVPNEDSPHGRHLEAQARAAESGDSMPLAPAPAAGRMSAGAAGESSSAADAPGPFGTTAGAGGRSSETATVQLSTVMQRAEEAAAAAPAAPGSASVTKHSEQELEDLAHQLYGHIRQRLRRELLTDRERAGAMVDLQ